MRDPQKTKETWSQDSLTSERSPAPPDPPSPACSHSSPEHTEREMWCCAGLMVVLMFVDDRCLKQQQRQVFRSFHLLLLFSWDTAGGLWDMTAAVETHRLQTCWPTLNTQTEPVAVTHWHIWCSAAAAGQMQRRSDACTSAVTHLLVKIIQRRFVFSELIQETFGQVTDP